MEMKCNMLLRTFFPHSNGFLYPYLGFYFRAFSVNIIDNLGTCLLYRLYYLVGDVWVPINENKFTFHLLY